MRAAVGVNRVFIYLGRFAVIMLGFGAASLAASAFIHLLFLGTSGFTAEETPAIVTGSFVFSIPFVALFVSYFAFFPTLVVIVIAELLARRDWLFHALGGALIGMAVVAMFWGVQAPVDGFDLPADGPAVPNLVSPGFIGLMVGAGIVGGLAYWLVAGRFSGNWREPIGAPTSPGRTES